MHAPASTASAAHSLEMLPLQRPIAGRAGVSGYHRWVALAHHSPAWVCTVLPELHAALKGALLGGWF